MIILSVAIYCTHDLCKDSTSVSRALESLHTILHSGGRGLMLLITADERRGRNLSGLSSSACIAL